jgi:hypothetical protein
MSENYSELFAGRRGHPPVEKEIRINHIRHIRSKAVNDKS